MKTLKQMRKFSAFIDEVEDIEVVKFLRTAADNRIADMKNDGYLERVMEEVRRTLHWKIMHDPAVTSEYRVTAARELFYIPRFKDALLCDREFVNWLKDNQNLIATTSVLLNDDTRGE